MYRKSGKQVAAKNIERNSRAVARERERKMNPNEHSPYVLVWVYMGRRAPYREKVLKILSRQPGGEVSVARLFAMCNYSNPTQFRTSVLRRLQQLGFIKIHSVVDNVKLTRLGWLVVRQVAL